MNTATNYSCVSYLQQEKENRPAPLTVLATVMPLCPEQQVPESFSERDVSHVAFREVASVQIVTICMSSLVPKFHLFNQVAEEKLVFHLTCSYIYIYIYIYSSVGSVPSSFTQGRDGNGYT
jgi:hypothetical protein